MGSAASPPAYSYVTLISLIPLIYLCPADCSATLRSSVEEMKEIKEIIFCGTKRLKVVIDAMNTVIKDVISIEIHKDSYL